MQAGRSLPSLLTCEVMPGCIHTYFECAFWSLLQAVEVHKKYQMWFNGKQRFHSPKPETSHTSDTFCKT